VVLGFGCFFLSGGASMLRKLGAHSDASNTSIQLRHQSVLRNVIHLNMGFIQDIELHITWRWCGGK
jgi:hypothetical protein